MNSIGERLRRQRMQRRASLDDIARGTKIGVHLLEAIEAEQFDKLPGGVFRRSFVLQYARALGLDEQEIAAELKRNSQFEEPPSVPGQEPPRMGSDMAAIPQADPWAPLGLIRNSLGALTGTVVVILVCAALYSWWQRPKQNEPVPAQVQAASPQAPRQPVAAPVTPAVPPVVETASGPPSSGPAPPASTPAPETAQTPPQQTQGVTVGLVADEKTWVRITSDGKILFANTLQPHETKYVQANKKVRLLVGNAGGIEVSLNGKPIGPIGSRGQITVVELTQTGFQIVSRNPPAAEPL